MWTFNADQELVQDGVTWAEFQQENEGAYKYWVVYDPATRIIVTDSEDLVNLWPHGYEVGGTDSLPTDYEPSGMFLYGRDGTVTKSLELSRVAKITELTRQYRSGRGLVVTIPVEVGGEYTFQADNGSYDFITRSMSIYGQIGEVPADFFWKAADNTEVPFTLNDLRNLAKAVGDIYWTKFKKYQDLKFQVTNSRTVDQVESVPNLVE